MNSAVPVTSPPPPVLPPAVQCQCCENRTLVLQDVCLEHSAGLVSLLQIGGVMGATLESLDFDQCHLIAAGVAPPPGDAGEAQRQALASLAFLTVSECYGTAYDGGVEEALEVLLAQTEDLVGLTIRDTVVAADELEGLLDGVYIDTLELEGCGLESFPYFEGLEGEAGRRRRCRCGCRAGRHDQSACNRACVLSPRRTCLLASDAAWLLPKPFFCHHAVQSWSRCLCPACAACLPAWQLLRP